MKEALDHRNVEVAKIINLRATSKTYNDTIDSAITVISEQVDLTHDRARMGDAAGVKLRKLKSGKLTVKRSF